MKRAIIFLNGDRTDLTRIKSYIDKETIVIGVDGGTNHILSLKLKPGVVIGDFDSFSKKLAGVKYLKHPRDKSQTDSELAIQYAINQGVKEIIVAGFLGTRIDHLLANIILLKKKEFVKVSIKIIEGNQEIYLVRRHAVIHGKKGDTISFIPIDSAVNEIKSIGLQYDLSKYTLSQEGNIGVSNILTKNIAEITLKQGVLLVVHEFRQ